MAMAVKQYKLYGEVSTPMYLVNALQVRTREIEGQREASVLLGGE